MQWVGLSSQQENGTPRPKAGKRTGKNNLQIYSTFQRKLYLNSSSCIFMFHNPFLCYSSYVRIMSLLGMYSK